MNPDRERLNSRQFLAALGELWLEITGLDPSRLRPRLRTWQLMVAVLAIGLFILIYDKVYNYNSEPDRSLLEKGDQVFVSGLIDDQVPVLDDPDFSTMNRLGFITGPKPIELSAVLVIPTGTKCVAIADYAADRDDCSSGNRRVVVRVVEGRYSGLVVPLKRWCLRPR